MFYITKNNSAADNNEFASVADAIAHFAKAPWAGAAPLEIEMVSANEFTWRGNNYIVQTGSNPRLGRLTPAAKPTFRPAYRYQGALHLSRDMNRADSNN